MLHDGLSRITARIALFDFCLPIFGSVYSLVVDILFLCDPCLLQPAKRHAYAQGGDNIFAPVERELIFDIVSYWTHEQKDSSLYLSFFVVS